MGKTPVSTCRPARTTGAANASVTLKISLILTTQGGSRDGASGNSPRQLKKKRVRESGHSSSAAALEPAGSSLFRFGPAPSSDLPLHSDGCVICYESPWYHRHRAPSKHARGPTPAQTKPLPPQDAGRPLMKAHLPGSGARLLLAELGPQLPLADPTPGTSTAKAHRTGVPDSPLRGQAERCLGVGPRGLHGDPYTQPHSQGGAEERGLV